MTIIYRTENTSIRKEKANQYLLRVNDWEKYKIFWVNFPFTHVKVIKDKKGGTAKEFREFTIHADSIQTLAQAVKGRAQFPHLRDGHAAPCRYWQPVTGFREVWVGRTVYQ